MAETEAWIVITHTLFIFVAGIGVSENAVRHSTARRSSAFSLLPWALVHFGELRRSLFKNVFLDIPWIRPRNISSRCSKVS